ncbi:hypothetical protein PAXRUDRAFT_831413 [Paxillus rubicundulus Ve08.2h10]|uniref:N-acetyltransferase domain-containing protein n=1 Tax=Paxillus rubicundulus Ve08.2h10 TaxID=930991 RepID=A0A0D0DWZ5_9AGAM|nr:hypothetical protein PAXRUDRAFT_831413 [Paxillus rubicundulus Ve08.2h10]
MHGPKNRDDEFSTPMFPKFWGKGYGTEATRFTVGYAFSVLGLQRLSLSVMLRRWDYIQRCVFHRASGRRNKCDLFQRFSGGGQREARQLG